MLSEERIRSIESAEAEEGLRQLATLFPGQVVFSTSLGQEDQVITHLLFSNGIPVKVFTLDTGRLFPESYTLIERTEARYGQRIQVYFPDPAEVEDYVNTNGINGFYESVDNRKSCCHIRKVKPLNRALAGARVWVTGLRAAQSANRQQMSVLEWDAQRSLYKYNPLLNWTDSEMLGFIGNHRIPCNPLHDQGFISIGCAPCTRAIAAGEDPRAGRWWWESSHKECGLHEKTSTIG